MAEGGRGDIIDDRQGGNGGISNTVEVRGFLANINKELLEMYFENSRRSGGGDTEEVQIGDGVAYITFMEAEVAKRVVSRSNHQVDGQTLTVALFHPSPSKPCYKNRVLIQGLNNAITEELLTNFLEKGTEAKVREFLYGEEEGNVVVTLSDNIDIAVLRKIFRERSIERAFLQVARVDISNCIIVQNIQPSTSHDVVLFYFENKRRSGGGDVERVEMKADEGYCLVYFEDPSVIDRVLSRSHKVDGANVEVHLHHECLGQRSSRNRVDPYLRISSPGKTDSAILEEENIDNKGKDKTSSSVSSNPEKESDFVEVQEWQEVDGKNCTLTLWIKYKRALDMKIVKDMKKVPCSWNFHVYWNFYTKTTQGQQMLPEIISKYNCSVAVCSDDEDLFIFEVTEKCFEQESDVVHYIHDVLDNIYRSAQQFLYLGTLLVDQRMQGDVLQLMKQRKVLDGVRIELMGQQDNDAMCVICTEKDKMSLLHAVTEIIHNARECFENHEETISVDHNWQKVMKTFGYIQKLCDKFPKVTIILDETKPAILLKGPGDQSKPAILLKGPRDQSKAAADHLRELVGTAQSEVKEDIFSPGCQFEIFTYPEMCDYIDNIIMELSIVWIPNLLTKKIHLFSKKQDKIKNIDKIIRGCVQERAYPLQRDQSGHSPEIYNSLETLKKKHTGKIVVNSSARGLLVTTADDIFESVDAAMQEIISKQTENDSPTGSTWIKNLTTSAEEKERYLEPMTEAFQEQLQHLQSGHKGEVNKRCNHPVSTAKSMESVRHSPPSVQQNSSIEQEDTPGTSWQSANGENENHGKQKILWTYPNKKVIVLLRDTMCDAEFVITPEIDNGVSSYDKNTERRLSVPLWKNEGKEKKKLSEEIEKVLKRLNNQSQKSASFCIQQIGEWKFKRYFKCFLYEINKFYNDLSVDCSVEYFFLLISDEKLYQVASDIADVFLQNKASRTPSKVYIEHSGTMQEDGEDPVFRIITVSIQKGQLHEAQTDILVNTISTNLDLTIGTTSASLLKKAGQGLKKEISCKFKPPAHYGIVMKTGACQLKCKAIYHGALKPYHDQDDIVSIFQQFLSECLQQATKSKYKSIAFPAIGTGWLGYPKDMVANLMLTSVMEFEKSMPKTSLKEVKFVIHPKSNEAYQAFQEQLQHLQSGHKGEVNKRSNHPVSTAKSMESVRHSPPLVQPNSYIEQEDTPRTSWQSANDSEGSFAAKTVPHSQTDKKCCIVISGDIKDRKALENRFSRFNHQFKPKHIVCPYGEKSALLIFEKNVDVKTLTPRLKPLKVEQLQPKEVKFLVPDGLVERAHNADQMEMLFTNLQEVTGVEVTTHDKKTYLNGVTTRQIDIAKNYLDDFEKRLNITLKKQRNSMSSDSLHEGCDNQINTLNNVSEVEFKALEILVHGFERIKNVQLSWHDGAVLIDGPATEKASIKTDLISQLNVLRNKQSVEIALDDEEKKIVKDVMGDVQSEDTVCVYDEKKSLVVVYSDKQDDIMKFKHNLKFQKGKLKGSVRSRKRFAVNTQLLETSRDNFSSSFRSTEIGQDILWSKGALDKAEYHTNEMVKIKTSQESFRSSARPTEIREKYSWLKEIGQEFSWSKDASDVEVFYTKENIKVAVYKADILNLPVDCIVNAANDRMQHEGGVARVIADAAGPELVKEGDAIIRQQGRIPVGCQVTTTAGRLPYKCVIHTVGPCWSDYQPHNLQKVQQCEKDLYAAIYGCFTEAERNGLSTVALPEVSSGMYAVPQEMCAVQYAKAVVDYSRNSRQGRALKEIHFIDKLPNLVMLMQDTFRTMIQNGMVPNYNIQNYVCIPGFSEASCSYL